ncbi:MAG: gamma carbonic anhydrase family protein [Polyangiaceae bacterium]|nr:gamma carbonic anhydrase family protein [Polyangiaceae bacterium]
MPILRAFNGVSPRIASDAFIAENATLIGDVVVAAGASVWYGAVLRGDCGRIRIGERSNVQDLSCVHMTTGVSHTEVGSDVTIGHGVVLHGARIGDRALIGMGSVLLDNVEIGEECLVAAGSVVPPRMKVPPRMLVRGAPAKIIREVSEQERRLGLDGAVAYSELARLYRG